MSDETTGIAAEIRRALLAAAGPLSIAQIFAACDSVSTTTQVASLMNTERTAGRVDRTGEPGSFRYALTETGRACARDPRLLRSRSNRRVRGRPRPPLASQASTPVLPEQPESPPQGSTPEGLHAAGWIAPERIVESIKSLATPTTAEIAAQASAQPADAGAIDIDERSARLAGAVLAHWPTSIRTMPAELLQAVQASLAPMLAA